MAIGARPGEIVIMILRQGMGLALVGVGLGLAAAFALTQSVRSFLFGVTPTDPVTFVGVAAVLAAAACAACYIPARRAAQIDPLRALRVE
jgi:putative ABC transport system permease protein